MKPTKKSYAAVVDLADEVAETLAPEPPVVELEVEQVAQVEQVVQAPRWVEPPAATTPEIPKAPTHVIEPAKPEDYRWIAELWE